MHTAIPATAIVAIATVVAALITGVIAIVNLTLSKEQKVSEMRQAWIDGLREDLAKFFAGFRYLANAVHDVLEAGKDGRTRPYPASADHIADSLMTIGETRYRIKLRLNKMKTEHIELERLVDAVVDQYNAEGSNNPKMRENVFAAIGLATNQSRTVLKTEWERVKRGEEQFNSLRRWLAPIILVFMIAFVAAILLTA